MSIASAKPLIKALADGAYHSGESLGALLGVSRAAVWKQIQNMQQYGLSVETVKGQGYRLTGGIDLLDRANILRQLHPTSLARVRELTILDEVNSTNAYLLATDAQHGDVCIAEFQSAGKGRRGRTWVSPYGRNIYLSVCLKTQAGVAALEGLSLAVGLVAAQSLEPFGATGIELKWPNDLLLHNRKLGGILIEVGGDLAGECKAIIGLGINVHMADSVLSQGIDQPWTDLKTAGVTTTRNALCAALLSELLNLINQFEQVGFEAYRDAWMARAAYLNQEVSLLTPAKAIRGYLRGVDGSGGLLLADTPSSSVQQVFTGGEISLRAMP